jgi:hypothetical protein
MMEGKVTSHEPSCEVIAVIAPNLKQFSGTKTDIFSPETDFNAMPNIQNGNHIDDEIDLTTFYIQSTN